jgi:hypothetical protein
MEKQATRKSVATAESSGCGQIATAAISLDDFLKLVEINKNRPFDFDTMVNLPPGMFAAGEHLYNRTNRIRDFLAEASDYHWKCVAHDMYHACPYRRFFIQSKENKARWEVDGGHLLLRSA